MQLFDRYIKVTFRNFNQMKSVFTLLLCFSFFSTQAQPLEKAVDAFEKADAVKIGNLMGQDIELSLLNNVEYCSKSKAIARLKSFFKKYPPRKVSVIHRGASKNSDSNFVIAQLNAGSEFFRLYMYAEAHNGTLKLAEIRVERE